MNSVSIKDENNILPATVLILAGGTGGHIFPGLAVAETLRSRGVDVRWLGARGAMEEKIVPAHGITLDTVTVYRLRGKGCVGAIKALVQIIKATCQAVLIVRRYKPDAILSFGGFAAGPGGLAAFVLRIPLVVHEQNRAPGFTNTLLSRIARRVLTGFPGAFCREEVVGNPIRQEIAHIAGPEERFAKRHGPMRLLILGGSQGAAILNQQVPIALAGLDHQSVEVRHQCGARWPEETRNIYVKLGVQASITSFISDMTQAYQWADVVICRSGASTLAEICAVGVGSVLVPFAAAVDDHQTRNAEYLCAAGAAYLVRQNDGLAQGLQAIIQQLLSRPAERLSMAMAARTLAKPAAASQISDIVLEECSHIPPGLGKIRSTDAKPDTVSSQSSCENNKTDKPKLHRHRCSF